MALFQGSNPDHYAKCYNTYTDACNVFERYTEWVRDYFPGEVEAKLCSTKRRPDELCVLGVGSGPGEKPYGSRQ